MDSSEVIMKRRNDRVAQMKTNMEQSSLATPYYMVDEALLRENLQILKYVEEKAGCKILLAQKAFSMYEFYPVIREYISGSAASGLYEAKLGAQEMGGETHIFSTAFKDEEFDEILSLGDHIIFNSFTQWERFQQRALQAAKAVTAVSKDNCVQGGNATGSKLPDSNKKPEFGIRINPEHTTQDHAIYDPCSPGSRLGVTRANFRTDLLEGISGLHFHTLCEQNSDDLAETIQAVEEKFGEFLPGMKWVNFGGGHHITRKDYDVERLIKEILRFKEKYKVEVYLEPGEAIALNAGFLIGSVLDITSNGLTNAILDVSAACHMPDVLEMPYRPEILGAGKPGEKAFTYRLGGQTCLAGDIIGDYSFDHELVLGEKLIFCDMAIYSMVKNNTFNGMQLPSIAAADKKGEIRLVRAFGYETFKERLS